MQATPYGVVLAAMVVLHHGGKAPTGTLLFRASAHSR
jgi:hypothetical protein